MSVKGRFILEITEGMLYLHEQGLVHKDLKPENILVDKDFHIKVRFRLKMENADNLHHRPQFICIRIVFLIGR